MVARIFARRGFLIGSWFDKGSTLSTLDGNRLFVSRVLSSPKYLRMVLESGNASLLFVNG